MATTEKTTAPAKETVVAATAAPVDMDQLRASIRAELEAELASKVAAEIGPESEASHLNTIQLGAMSEQMGIPATTVFCDPKKCPSTHVNMFTADDRRIACTSGRVYLFAAGENLYVHKEDRNTCANHGAADTK